jgi:peroxiredoxin
MSEVRSTFRLKLGDQAPIFSLPDPDVVSHALPELQGSAGLLLVFAYNHCP